MNLLALTNELHSFEGTMEANLSILYNKLRDIQDSVPRTKECDSIIIQLEEAMEMIG